MSQSLHNEGSDVGRSWLDFEQTSNRASWIVSYADIMTIILTFFVLLLSISTIAQTKFEMLVESITGRQVGNLREVKTRIDEVVERKSLGGQISTKIDEDGLKIEFANALLFDSGEADLNPGASEVLAPISAHLVENLEPHYGITIEGYTDDIPISNAEFDSNWELSTNRAIHVMKRLQEAGLSPKRMSVQGYADTRSATDVDLHDPAQMEALSPEEREEARAANRRVVFRIHPLDAEVVADLVGEEMPADAERVEPETAESETAEPETAEQADTEKSQLPFADTEPKDRGQ